MNAHPNPPQGPGPNPPQGPGPNPPQGPGPNPPQAYQLGTDDRRFAADPSQARDVSPVIPVGPTPEVDDYSRLFYDDAYLATGKGSGIKAVSTRTAQSHEPYRASHRQGAARGSSTQLADGAQQQPQRGTGSGDSSRFAPPTDVSDDNTHVVITSSQYTPKANRIKHPLRNSLWIVVGAIGAFLAVLLLVIALFFVLPDARTEADPLPSPPPTRPAGGETPSVPEGMDPVILGGTVTVPQDPDDPDNTIVLEFTALDPIVEDNEGVVAELGLWSGEGYTYAVLIADVTNTGSKVDFNESMLPVFLATAEGNTPYRYETVVNPEKAWSAVRLDEGETVELAFIFPIPDGQTVVDVGVAAQGQWWDLAVWTPAPETKEV